VIEDNVDVREYIKSYVNVQYRVIEAFDGNEGIIKAMEYIPDLVISDVMMPKKDGYEVCLEIKKNELTSHIPVILLTAKAAREDKISGLETGADDYLIKPFDSHELLVRVKNLIDSRRRLREKYGLEVMTLKPEEITVVPSDQVFVAKVKTIIEQNMGDENFDVEQLASALSLSYTQLHRKLKAVTNQTANQFIRSMRLHRAMDIIRQNGQTIAETAYSVGFSSPSRVCNKVLFPDPDGPKMTKKSPP
ncbi:MAG: ATP-binding region ATPase domain protein, partial [Parcubacteria group bacterium GW2011_GWA2_46_7]